MVEGLHFSREKQQQNVRGDKMLERSDFSFFDALRAGSTDPDVLARHKVALSLGAKDELIIVYHVPSLQIVVPVASQKVRPRRSVLSWPHASVALSASILRLLQPPTA